MRRASGSVVEPPRGTRHGIPLPTVRLLRLPQPAEKAVPAVAGRAAHVQNRVAPRTSLLPGRQVLRRGRSGGGLGGLFQLPRAFGIVPPDAALRVDAAVRIAELATDRTAPATARVVQRDRLAVHHGVCRCVGSGLGGLSKGSGPLSPAVAPSGEREIKRQRLRRCRGARCDGGASPPCAGEQHQHAPRQRNKERDLNDEPRRPLAEDRPRGRPRQRIRDFMPTSLLRGRRRQL